MCRAFVLSSLAALALAFAPAPFPRPERRADAVNEMIGEWEYPHFRTSNCLAVTHDRMTYGPASAYVLKIDPRARPRTYDITGVGLANQSLEFRGIYKVEGDTLTLTYNQGTSNRPASFEPQQGRTEVYKRRR